MFKFLVVFLDICGREIFRTEVQAVNLAAGVAQASAVYAAEGSTPGEIHKVLIEVLKRQE